MCRCSPEPTVRIADRLACTLPHGQSSRLDRWHTWDNSSIGELTWTKSVRDERKSTDNELLPSSHDQVEVLNLVVLQLVAACEQDSDFIGAQGVSPGQQLGRGRLL